MDSVTNLDEILTALARRVAAWESDEPLEAVPEDEVRKLVVELHQEYVGVFRDTACVEYDERSGVIRYRDPPTPLPELLDVVSAVEHPEREQPSSSRVHRQ